ncbi:hypothetical protein [Actinophytocola sp.]|uniref:hypothetical protein n=1 Tax=Actinophytocola sp. TaxID=1872138 RepID=UPI003D6AB6DC
MSIDTGAAGRAVPPLDSDDWIGVSDDPDQLYEQSMRDGWGDGLPIVPSTPERMSQFLAAVGDIVFDEERHMLPGGGEVTLERLAANAIMAGCRAEYFPVLVLAVKCMLRKQFNLLSVQTTTHPVAPLLVVHGPVAQDLGMNSGAGMFGPGNRANATIGRAVRLVLMNVGGAYPGARDKATQGQPSKYSFCIAENTTESPWPPYCVDEFGADTDASAVTVVAAENPQNVSEHVSTDAEGVLLTIADAATKLGSNHPYLMGAEVFVVLSPEHAQTVAGGGFSRKDVQMYLYENARIELARLKLLNLWGLHVWPPWLAGQQRDTAMMPVVSAPEMFKVLVGGGSGKHSCVLPGFGVSNAVTALLDTSAP